MKEEVSLKEWTVHFVKQKDLFSKSIISIKDEKFKDGDKLIVKQKDSEAYYLVMDEIKNEDFMRELDKKDQIGIVVSNKKKNLDFVTDNWKDFVAYPFLTIYFVNPMSTTDVKWIVKPSVHDRITEPKALKTGLKSMFAMVDEMR